MVIRVQQSYSKILLAHLQVLIADGVVLVCLLFDDEYLYYCDSFYLCACCENDFLQYYFLQDMHPSRCNNLESSELKFTTRSEGVSSKSAYSEKKTPGYSNRSEGVLSLNTKMLRLLFGKCHSDGRRRL